MRTLVAALAVLVLSSCRHSPELTAPEHRGEAMDHQLRAEQERAAFDPNESRAIPARSPFNDPGAVIEWVNPTASHLATADAEMRAAQAHLRAAKKIEAFEGEACAGIPPASRAACPLLSAWVERVRETGRGLELELKPAIDAAATLKLLRCHLAWDMANGFETQSCPLFIKGVSIEPEGRVLVFKAPSPDVRAPLHVAAQRVFGLPGVQTKAAP